MREREIEQKLIAKVRQRGGLAPKLVSPGTVGMPDRLVLLPEGKMAFVELKAPKKKARTIQEKRIRDLRNLGFRVYIVDCQEGIKEVLDAVQSTPVSKQS